ncbi:MAG: carbonic anhydrase [Candidatus Paceibacterales bacterium]
MKRAQICKLVAAILFALLVTDISVSQETHKAKFACAFNCMDSRCQKAVDTFVKNYAKTDEVDMVNEAGPSAIAAHNPGKTLRQAVDGGNLKEVMAVAILENVKERIGISVNKHGSKVVAIVAHYDCAGNPSSKEQQIQDLHTSKRTIESFGFKDIQIILLWVDKDFKVAQKVK